jgi:nucleoid-associated protein
VVAAANHDDDVEQTYVAFVGKNKDNDASGYFVDALGCTKGIPSSRATDNALSGVRSYFGNAEVLRRYRTAAHDSVVLYLQAQMDRKEPASLEGIVHAASSVVPGEFVAALASLSSYLNDEERRVPEAFHVHASTLKKRTSIKADESGWKVQFEQQLLGSTPNAAFYYDEQAGTLTISRLPERFKRKMEDVLRDRAADD